MRSFRHIDPVVALRELRGRRVNFTAEEVGPRSWQFDTHRHHLERENPGPPEEGGVWEVACGLVADYEFSVPGLIRAFYDRREPLERRDMLLEGLFCRLRFYMGVRVTRVTDEVRDGYLYVWGWAYETLEGHLERGRMDYEIVKDSISGDVEFVISGYSQLAPTSGVVVRLGWLFFGRRTQLRFYARCGARLRELVRACRAGAEPPPAMRWGNVVLAPSDVRAAPPARLTIPWSHPGSRRRRSAR